MNVPARAVQQPAEFYRQPPHNIEAEQALLGAILVNNDAFTASPTSSSRHFFEPCTGASTRWRRASSGRQDRDPITLKTFLPAIRISAASPGSQYLARLAAEATTVINAEDYGRTIYDLALRRSLIGIGEDVVNIAFDAPSTCRPRRRSRTPSAASTHWPKPAATTAASSAFEDALKTAIDMASRGLSARWPPVRHLHRPRRSRSPGRPAASDLIVLAGRPAMGKTSLVTNIAFNIAKAYRGREAAGRLDEDRQWRHRRLLLARNVGGAAGNPYRRRAIGRFLLQDPPWRSIARTISPVITRPPARCSRIPLLYRPDRRHLDRAARPPAPAA
jgi:replicative DNA helicase